MPTTPASVIQLPARLPVLLETLTSPCKYQIRFSFPNLPVNTYPFLLEEVCMRSLQNEWRGELLLGFKTVGFRSHCDCGMESCLLRVSKLLLIYSLRSLLSLLKWTLPGARANCTGRVWVLQQLRAQGRSVLFSVLRSLLWPLKWLQCHCSWPVFLCLSGSYPRAWWCFLSVRVPGSWLRSWDAGYKMCLPDEMLRIPQMRRLTEWESTRHCRMCCRLEMVLWLGQA